MAVGTRIRKDPKLHTGYAIPSFPGMKLCSACNTHIKIENFHSKGYRKGKPRLSHSCNKCTNIFNSARDLDIAHRLTMTTSELEAAIDEYFLAKAMAKDVKEEQREIEKQLHIAAKQHASDHRNCISCDEEFKIEDVNYVATKGYYCNPCFVTRKSVETANKIADKNAELIEWSRSESISTHRDSGRYRRLWELLKWPIPNGWVVHHINRNFLDNRIENLSCMSVADHIAAHANDDRTSPLRKVGPAGTAWCHKCKLFLPVAKFSKSKHKWNGLKAVCRPCDSDDKKARRAEYRLTNPQRVVQRHPCGTDGCSELVLVRRKFCKLCVDKRRTVRVAKAAAVKKKEENTLCCPMCSRPTRTDKFKFLRDDLVCPICFADPAGIKWAKYDLYRKPY